MTGTDNVLAIFDVIAGELSDLPDVTERANSIIARLLVDGLIIDQTKRPASPSPGLREAAEALSNFAWSAVSADCDEAREYLNTLVADLRRALATDKGE